jgi:hypothetical protein
VHRIVKLCFALEAKLVDVCDVYVVNERHVLSAGDFRHELLSALETWIHVSAFDFKVQSNSTTLLNVSFENFAAAIVRFAALWTLIFVPCIIACDTKILTLVDSLVFFHQRFA